MMRVLCLVVLVCAVVCSPMSQDELEDFSNFLLKTSQLDLQVKKGADSDYDENEIVSDHAWEDSGKFEGDLILNDRQRRLIVENVEGLSRNGLTDSTKKWPDNEVVYFIQREHFNGGQVQAIQDGIDDLARASCVKFRPYRKGDRDAVVIQGSRPGCFSQVGYQGGYQVLNLSGRHPVGRGCFRHGTVVHELLHSLGFYHMQSSPDRDDYIDVVWANIVQPARHNFRKYNSFSVSDFGVGYDYDSVLHYSRKAFSANGQDTLVPKQRGAAIGQRAGLSDKDTQKLNKMYCDANNDQVEADENSTQKPKKKKKPKNEPFQGHGIGYHQGKTLVIKLPVAQTFKLSNVPSTSVFDFSKTPQVVSTPEAEGYRFGKEVTYSYKPSLNSDTPASDKNQNGFEYKPSYDTKTPKHFETKNANTDTKDNDNGLPTQYSDEVKPEYVPVDEYDKDLKESFDRLTKIVKQHIYPQSQNFNSNINKDYRKFFSPTEPTNSDFEELISYERPTSSQHNSDTHKLRYEDDENAKEPVLRDEEVDDKIDNSYRTALPIKKPYNFYTQTETPQYATFEYLKGRNDYSGIYSPVSTEDDKYYHTYRDEPSREDHILSSYKEDKKPVSIEKFYTDKEKENTKGINNALKKEDIKEIKMNEKLAKDEIDKDVKDKIDSSYRTLFTTPKTTYSELYLRTEVPKYATLEYLKDRHNISTIYSPKKTNNDNSNEPQYNLLPEHNWYKNDGHKQSDEDYKGDFNTDFVRQDRARKGINDQTDPNNENIKAPKNLDEEYEQRYTDRESYKSSERPDSSYDYSNESRESSDNLTKPTHNDDHDYYTDFDDNGSDKEKENKKKNEHYSYRSSERPDSFYDYSNENASDNLTKSALNGDYTDFDDKDTGNGKEASKKNEHYRTNSDEFPDSYDHSNERRESKDNLTKSAQHNDHGHYRNLDDKDTLNSKEGARKSEHYTHYEEPTEDWFKPTYTIPKTVSVEDKR